MPLWREPTMTKETFLKELALGLTNLSQEERRRVLEYYGELICDGIENGKSEESVIQDFGSPKEIAASICAEYGRTAPRKPASSDGQHIYASKEPVGAIILTAQNLRIEVRENAQIETVQVLFSPLGNDHVAVTEENSTFSFCHTITMQPFFWRDLFHGARSLILEVPVNFSGSLSIQTCNAKITVDSLHSIGTGSFITSNACIFITSTVCRTLQARTSNSRLLLLNCSGESCTAKTSNGRLQAEDCRFPTRLSLHTSNSPVRAEQLSSNNVELKTCNAPIHATLHGDPRDYTIHSHTSNGRSSLPADWSFPGQACSLSAVTSNASIDVKLVPE
ncbi:DUF1700 domain-containing protein [Caproicibacterium lactatifermentans]|uniref:DUF1700 domain-containing protein n=2 Tax=Oscillospiraceae TaxID=216572 RepID=A0A859DNQ5_9FIRM|nr:DUF1700 domain-containing protein [Caproicibacterium lactatifermentans]QKO29964.1 DUF1700 domain-containing protein [Caproicibacterium lactatifermentans]